MSQSSDRPRPGLGRRGEMLVAVQFALMIIFAVTPVWHPGLSPALLAELLLPRLILAIPFALAALVLGAMGSHHIREYLTPLPYPVDHSQLVQRGVYSLVRHPLYASLLSAAFAWTLYSFSLSHLLLLVVSFFFFDFKARKEEAWLTERHPEYRDYAARVSKFIPYLY
ncbi:isoprenylcysteine carboxylmethyltransferase family protein [Lamprobacter modestohalophilus]|uniref:methyltransferase family protein n=1 Tax=Lamprobacter modestohalophilus TaxID=1064514 RepID=UPI002ADEDECE|nr:isoprenylcysteine carboxylmethyltransferase family protein [Lamprobacter modestohalophilus]MEA1048705.1 isoprenylcysteine carboxylmethyltransferase family protein [Lamprobacter modestohalophilus]